MELEKGRCQYGPNWKKEEQMDTKEMKKILAGVGIAGLLSGVPIGGVAHGSSGWGGSGNSAVSTEKTEAVNAGSGHSGKEDSSMSTHEQTEESEGMMAPAPSEEKKGEPTGASGCSGKK